MTAIDGQVRLDAFLGAFFGEGNHINRTDVAPGGRLANEIGPWVGVLEHGDRSPVLLPRVGADSVDWYALAFDERQARAIREDLESFIGPTYTDWNRSMATLDRSDPVERAIADYAGTWVYRLRTTPKHNPAVRKASDRLRDAWQQRPLRERRVERPIGELLHEVELALAREDPAAVDALTASLRARSGLSAENFAFLEVRRLAVAGRWDELLALELLPTVLDLRRPRLVTQDIIRAIYRVHLERFEHQHDPGGALALFYEEIQPRYGAVFVTPRGLTAPEALKAFMLQATAPGSPDAALRDQLLASPDLRAADRPYISELAAMLHTGGTPPKEAASPEAIESDRPAQETAPDELTVARQALRAGHVDEAYAVLVPLREGWQRAALLVEAAAQLETLDAALEAVQSVQALPEDEQRRLLDIDRINVRFERVRATVGDAATPLPADWIEWIAAVVAGRLDDSVEVANHGADEWDVSSAATGQAPDQLAEAIVDTVGTDAGRTLRLALPALIRFLTRETDYRPALVPVWSAIAQSLAEYDKLTPQELETVSDAAAALLEAGIDADEYRLLAADVRRTWQKNQAPANLGWALDIAEQMVLHAAPDTDARALFFSDVLTYVAGASHRVEAHQWPVLELLGRDFSVSDQIDSLRARTLSPGGSSEEERETRQRQALRGRTVGVYTLDIAVARRVRDAIQRMFDDVDVQTRDAKVATKQLTALARKADIFLVGIGCAKHMATEAIDRARPAGSVTLRVSGRGSHQMLAALLAAVAAE